MAKLNLIRDIHQVSVLNLLRRHGSSSRARLAQELGLTRSTLSSLVTQLSEEGYVTESGRQVVRHGTGRPGVGLKLNADGAFFIGAEIGYGAMQVIMINLAAEVVARADASFDMSQPPNQVLQRLSSMVGEIRDRHSSDHRLTKGVGVTVPGTTASGAIVLSPALSWRDVDLQAPLGQVNGCPILVENNANAAALAELYFGGGESVQNLVFIHLGQGIGSGIVINGEIYRGSFGSAGEIGNIRLAPSGPTDSKGNKGTFEAFASTASVMRLYRECGGQSPDLAGLMSELDDEKSAATVAVRGWSAWLAQAILMLVNVLNPQKIVLGGPLATLVPAIMPHLERVVRSEQLPGSDRVTIEVSSLGENTNALGGAMLVYHTMFSLPGISSPGPVQDD